MFDGGTAQRPRRKQNHRLNPKNPTIITIWHYYSGVQLENFDNMPLEFNETACIADQLGKFADLHTAAGI